MKKVLLGTLIGFGLFGAGLYVGYLAIESIKAGGNPFLMLGSVVLCAGGMFVLYKAGRLDTFKSKIAPLKSPDEKGPNILKKNEQIVKEWSKTANTQEKLKVLEAAARAEEEK